MFLNESTGIIGGADWPTAVFLARNLGPLLWMGLSFLLPVLLAAGVRVLAPRFIGKHLSWKTSLVSAALACTGGLGLSCLLWCMAMGLGGLAMYPVALPAGVGGGLVALLVFVLLCLGYVWLRTKRPSAVGVAVDVATSILLLPGFTLLWMLLLTLVQNAA